MGNLELTRKKGRRAPHRVAPDYHNRPRLRRIASSDPYGFGGAIPVTNLSPGFNSPETSSVNWLSLIPVCTSTARR